MVNKMREYSIPLILGVIGALIWANIDLDSYNKVFFEPLSEAGKYNLHWFIENGFMVFFFGTAMVEIVKSLSPGGALNPIKKAVNPILATLGGVLGPIGVYFILNALIGSPDYSNGWGICTATDIAISWLAARIIFGKDSPATSFLLLLAVADDAIGLAIIAIFYPEDTPQPLWLLLCVAAMGLAWLMNSKLHVSNLWAYIIFCGGMSWVGMYYANISPALSLVLIVPFFPRKAIVRTNKRILVQMDVVDEVPPVINRKRYPQLSAFEQFEELIGPFVDFGLVFFGLANAGVAFSDMGTITLIVAASTILGKTIGIFGLSEVGRLAGFDRPDGMGKAETLVAGITGGMGLTVALFVAGAAFGEAAPELLAASKMGALFTVSAFIFAFATAKILKVKKM